MERFCYFRKVPDYKRGFFQPFSKAIAVRYSTKARYYQLVQNKNVPVSYQETKGQ